MYLLLTSLNLSHKAMPRMILPVHVSDVKIIIVYNVTEDCFFLTGNNLNASPSARQRQGNEEPLPPGLVNTVCSIKSLT